MRLPFELEHLALTRREMLHRCGMGFGALALGDLILQAQTASAASTNPLLPKSPQFTPRAKHVIHLFMNGGPSHVDTFDPKPALTKYAGKPLPGGSLPTERKTGAAFASPFKFHKYGQSGIEVSDIFRHTAESIDDVAVIRSMHADVPNHEPSLLLMNCGDARQIRPSLGSWLCYGLGSENQNLPAFVAMCPFGYPIQETQNWQAGFLPGIYEGTYIDTQHTAVEQLIEHIRNDRVSLPEQRKQLDLLERLNSRHLQARHDDAALDARIRSFELGFRMQTEAAEAFDVAPRAAIYPRHVRARRAGAATAHCPPAGRARRAFRAGLARCRPAMGQPRRSGNQPSPTGRTMRPGDRRAARGPQTARPVAGYACHLGRRVRPNAHRSSYRKQGSNAGKINGRDHNHYGFSMWLAGGGVRGGYVHGATDEFGFKAVEKPVHVHDLHATILYLMGFDHKKFTYRYAGRDFRLTDVFGHVVHDLIA